VTDDQWLLGALVTVQLIPELVDMYISPSSLYRSVAATIILVPSAEAETDAQWLGGASTIRQGPAYGDVTRNPGW
jgi:hypothetical protein